MRERYLPPLRSTVFVLYSRFRKKARIQEVYSIKKKMGRPLKAETNLSHDVKVRLDDETFAALLKYCNETGADRATVIREGLRKHLNINLKEK